MMMSSCVNDLPYDEQIGAPRLVLNALLLPDSTLTVTVGRTAHFLDTEEPQRLADATVTATINGKSITLTTPPRPRTIAANTPFAQEMRSPSPPPTP